MTIKLCVLGSGSKGNAIYFNVDGHQFLVDAGFTKKETAKRLAMIGREIKDIERVFVTHDHKDHLSPWVVKEGLMVEWTEGKNLFNHQTLNVFRFPLSHDSGSGSVGYVVSDKDGNKVTIALDTGCIPEEVLPFFFDANAILIETNYDVDMLSVGKYPVELLERIASDKGHLRNECASEVVELASWHGLEYVVCLHLSASNNNPTFARFCMESIGTKAEVIVSDQKNPTKMMTII